MRKSSKKGFTLAELLIVIAIIAVLVAIMIPVFGAQLNKATAAAELANVRAAYAEELATEMLGGDDLTNVVADAEVKGATLAEAVTDKHEAKTTIVLEKAPAPAAVDANGNKNGTGTRGVIKVTYNNISGTFEIDEDVKIMKADGTAYGAGETITKDK